MEKSLCPICGSKFSPLNQTNRTNREKSDFSPFCSKRCQLIDLGRWFLEDYTIPESDLSQKNENINNENT